MNDPSFTTVDEFVGLLKGGSDFPTLIVEGRDDCGIYSKFENETDPTGFSILEVGGRNNLLQIFKRRNEFAGRSNVAFMADRDAWIYSDIPAEYLDYSLIFTTGYSVENDAFVDARLWCLVDKAATPLFERDIHSFTKWYAREVYRYMSGRPHQFATSPTYVLNHRLFESVDSTGDDEYPHELFSSIHSNYKTHLRGKSLLEILEKHVGGGRRGMRLLMKSASVRPGDRVGQLYRKVFERLKLGIPADMASQ